METCFRQGQEEEDLQQEEMSVFPNQHGCVTVCLWSCKRAAVVVMTAVACWWFGGDVRSPSGRLPGGTLPRMPSAGFVLVCHVPSFVCMSHYSPSCFSFFSHKHPPHSPFHKLADWLIWLVHWKSPAWISFRDIVKVPHGVFKVTATGVWRLLLHCCWKSWISGTFKIVFACLLI